MKHIFTLFCFVFFGFTYTNGQLTRFALIQAEDNKAFFVKLPNQAKPLSSTNTGYLIIPKLTGITNIKLGFVGSSNVIDFSIDLNNGDKGFLLKNTEDKGWALFNWQNLDYTYQKEFNAIVKPDASETIKETATIKPEIKKPIKEEVVKNTIENKEEPVINIDKPITNKPKKDETIIALPTQANNLPTVKTEENKANANIIKDVVAVDTAEDNNKIIDTDKLQSNEELVKTSNNQPSIKLLKVNSDKKGYKATYKVINDDKTEDKVTVEIAPKILIDEEAELLKMRAQMEKDSLLKLQQITLVAQDSIASKPTVIKTTEMPTTPTVNTSEAEPKNRPVNNSCTNKEIANDTDVEELFTTIVAEKDYDEKVQLAKKMFKKKCFNSAQVKNLSGAFFNDRYKYELLYCAQPYVMDADNFKKLESLLSESVYLNMFRAMVNK
jgi:hypothetical protein